MNGKLYLVPTTLGDSSLESVLPTTIAGIVTKVRYFIVEDVRTARRFIKKLNANIRIDELTFFSLNQHTQPHEIASFLSPLLDGFDVAVISEAGCPAIADPGADVVAIAQSKQIVVLPLVGPSSILLALMASGFNGQSFAFSGYLPIQPEERIKAIKRLESRVYAEEQTQVFIETPYRNDKLVEQLLKVCQPNTKLCIGTDITLEGESIITKTILEWKKHIPQIGKKPTIFLLYH